MRLHEELIRSQIREKPKYHEQRKEKEKANNNVAQLIRARIINGW